MVTALARGWLLVLVAMLAGPIAWGQSPGQVSADGVWRIVTPAETMARNAALAESAGERFIPRSYRLFEMRPGTFREVLSRAVVQNALAPAMFNEATTEMTIPMPDGSFERFRIEETSTMAPELAARFPEIRSYRGQGLDHRGHSLVLTTGPDGAHAQVLTESGTALMDPFDSRNTYASYYKTLSRLAHGAFRCQVTTPPPGPGALAAGGVAGRMPVRSGQALRTYRLAVACTGEYAQKRGGTKSLVMAAINTTIARINQIYEQDLSIRLQLVANNDQIIFTSPSTDPFRGNDNADRLINESQSVIDARIGSANYDIGHTLSTGAGGLAGLGVVCRSGQKARGVTGSANPVGDPFDVDYVAHEMGHQFSGNHTFNGTLNSCSGGNRNGSTAFEPGSGSTIQAYAGICTADNLQPNSDDYFHAISLDEILTYVTNGPGSVVTSRVTGNTPPTVDAGIDVTIPHSTPFTLNAHGMDPNGDPLTFCWEQMDLGPQRLLSANDDGRIPLFRSFRPVADSSRTFPRLADLLTGHSSPSEKLPVRRRVMHFRVTARDNRMGGGGVAGDEVAVTVDSDIGPFRVTHPVANDDASGLIEVTWDVARTSQSPVSTAFVDILLSTDGGLSFLPLVSNTPNDGAEWVALPQVDATSAFVKVQAVGNIFFAVSQGFPIRAARASIIAVRHAEKETSGDDPELTAAGHNRALALQQILANSGLSDVYATELKRAQQTAQPTANAAGLMVQEYSDVAALAETLSQGTAEPRALVVGHSNTVPELLQALGVTEATTIGEDEFDRLFVVVIRNDGQVQFRQQRYIGEPVSTVARPVIQEAAGPVSPPPTTSLEAMEEHLRQVQVELTQLQEEMQKLKRELQPQENQH